MNDELYTYIFKGEVLQLLDALAKEYSCSRPELVSKSLLITKSIVDGPNPFECSWEEWYEHFRKMYEEAQIGDEESWQINQLS